MLFQMCAGGDFAGAKACASRVLGLSDRYALCGDLGRRACPATRGERIYVVGPTGQFFDHPNLTDKEFPGHPTQSCRWREPLRAVGEVTAWQGHSPQRLKQMKDHLARLRAQGIEAID